MPRWALDPLSWLPFTEVCDPVSTLELGLDLRPNRLMVLEPHGESAISSSSWSYSLLCVYLELGGPHDNRTHFLPGLGP